MDPHILDEISLIVAQALDAGDASDLGARLNAAIPGDLEPGARAGALAEAVVYSLVCERPGYPDDGRPGFLPSTANLREAVLNEIGAMIEADFDREEHDAAWQSLRESVAAAPESDFAQGVAVNCPDDYLLSLDRASCRDVLKERNMLPAWAEAAGS